MFRTGIKILILLVAATAFAQERNQVEIYADKFGTIQYAGFRLNSEKTLHIETTGAGQDRRLHKKRDSWADPENLFVYSWILNAKTREMVWRLTIDDSRRDRRTQFNRQFEGDVDLPAGEYEVYLSAQEPSTNFFDDGFFSLGKLLNRLLQGDEWFDSDEMDWFIRVSDVDEAVNRASVDKYHKARQEQAVVSITGLRDSDFRQEGFKLTKRGTFQIYALGEGFRGDLFDYGWIVDASTSEKVWEASAKYSEDAGGATKNRLWKEEIKLKPGDYWVYFAMDDTHSPDHWNANPPYDPQFYGITITGVEGEYDPGSIEKLLKRKIKPIVSLTRIRDDEFVQEGFTLSAGMDVRVYALGEGRDGEMFDYGWIENAANNETVWQMRYSRTRHAGGASKNRMIDEVINLPAGSYMVYYRTDDSHSYRDWNSSPPYNPKNWGITIYPADPKFAEGKVREFRQPRTGDLLISQIVRVEDGQQIQKRFQLDETTKIRIVAIGEGDWDEMYDYGWIEDDDTGETVWRMKYSRTRWAGGAKKNRKVDTKITLEPGRYLLRYKSDDSHSFEDWNDDPPDQPQLYGITLYKIGE